LRKTDFSSLFFHN